MLVSQCPFPMFSASPTLHHGWSSPITLHRKMETTGAVLPLLSTTTSTHAPVSVSLCSSFLLSGCKKSPLSKASTSPLLFKGFFLPHYSFSFLYHPSSCFSYSFPPAHGCAIITHLLQSFNICYISPHL